MEGGSLSLSGTEQEGKGIGGPLSQIAIEKEGEEEVGPLSLIAIVQERELGGALSPLPTCSIAIN